MLRDRLDARLAKLGIADAIRFVGQQEDVVPWLQALDIDADVGHALHQVVALRAGIF